MAEYRTRIIDIADELGLSTATVSNVIHGKTKKISDKTVRRVKELLEKMQRKEEVFPEYSLELKLIPRGTTSSYNGV